MRRVGVIMFPAILLLSSAPPEMAGRGQSAAPAPASLADLSWLAGRCVGNTRRGAYIEELWMPGHDGLMLGSFRWDRGNGR